MTTYNLRILRIIDQFNPGSNEFETLDVRTLDGSISLVGDGNLVSYEPLLEGSDGLEIELDVSAIGSFIVDGQIITRLDLESTSLIGVVWSLAGVQKSSTILAINFENPQAGIETSYSFVVGGDIFPEFATAQEFEAFETSIISFGLPLAHELGPGNTINMDTVPSVVTTSENDYIRVIEDATNAAFITGGDGSDTIDFSDAFPAGAFYLDYAPVTSGPITVLIDGSEETGSIAKQGSGIDSFVDLGIPLTAGWVSFGGFSISGTFADDTLTVKLDEQWIELIGGVGNDTFNLDLTDPGIVRLSYNQYGGLAPTTGIAVNLNTGVVSNDGFNGTDQINAIRGLGQLELHGTYAADLIIGSSANERFILLGGNDTLDGGAGVDLVRYDRNGVSGVDINLATGVGTGSYFGTAFTHALSNIEQVRGSRNGNDRLTGNADDNLLVAYDGNDILIGGAGNDTIFGGSGFDTVVINANLADIAVQNDFNGWRIASSDGVDLVGYDVEQFQFNDITVSGSAIQAMANVATDDLVTFVNDTVTGEYYFANTGNDTLDASNITDGYVEISYEGISSGPIQVNFNAVTNTGTIVKGTSGTDTFVNFNNAAGAGWMTTTGGLFVDGTAFNDTFDVTVNNSFIGLVGGVGNDTYNIDLANAGFVRVDFRAAASGQAATQGLNVDLRTGVVSNDGFGGTDQINLIAVGAGSMEIGGTRNTDVMIGTERGERFITLGGNDTVDGGGGLDTVRYDRAGMDAVNVNLGTGVATGVYQGTAFTQTLINIEGIRGSRNGNDTIIGNAEANILGGMGGDDVIYGEGGNDSLYGWEGNDTLYGGAGQDYLEGNDGEDILYGGAGNDTLYGGAGNDTLYGGFLQDILYGQDGNDVLHGDEGLDILFGGAGNDTLYGGGDQDTLYGGAGADFMDGGDGSDVYFVDGLDTIEDTGTFGYDRAQIMDAAGVALTQLATWSGVERVNGFTGNDTLDATGATQAYFLFGNDGDDVLIGGSGADTILGGNGNDILFGGDGNDILQGGTGNDTFYGGAGDDIIYVGQSGDFVADAGPGFDRVLINNPNGLSIEVGGWLGVERIVGFTGNDTIDATGATTGMIFALGAGDDVLIGGDGDDTVYAGEGNDLVFGGDGDDALIGGNGNDTLIGGAGNDFLLGGAGADVFVFADNFGIDVIRDFEDGIDLIDFSGHTGVSGFGDLVTQQAGNNVIINVSDDGPNQITLTNFNALNLLAEDFIFA